MFHVVIVAGLGDPLVKAAVLLGHLDRIAGLRSPLEILHENLDGLHVAVTAPHGSKPCNGALANVHGLEIRPEASQFERRHTRALVGHQRDHSLGTKPNEGFAHRGSGHTEQADQAALFEFLARFEIKAQDALLDRVIGPVDARSSTQFDVPPLR